MSPEAVQKIEETAAAKTAGTTGAKPQEAARVVEAEEEEKPAQVVDITEHAKAEDVELFAKWDAKDEGAPKFVRTRVEKLFAEKGEAGVNAEYKGEDNVSRYARYRLGILTGKKGEEEHAKTETEAAATGIEVAAGAERGGGAAAEGAGKPAARGAGAAEAGAAATAEEGEAEVKEKALTGDKAAEVGGAPGEGTLAEEGFRAWKANKAYIDNNGNYHVPLPGSRSGPIAKWNKAVKKLYPKHEDFQKASDEWALKASEEGEAETEALTRNAEAEKYLSEYVKTRTTPEGKPSNVSGANAHAEKVARENPAGAKDIGKYLRDNAETLSEREDGLHPDQYRAIASRLEETA